MNVRFMSGNRFKIEEATRILQKFDIEVVPNIIKIEEIQTLDTQALIRDKALKAFKIVGRPLFVEHTGLYLDLLNGFPGGLTQIFWDTLKKERFAERFASEQLAKARTEVCYIDGKKAWHFHGEVTGKIVNPPRIDHGFQWDCVFVPDGFEESFSEMGPRKDEISMRKIALEALAKHVVENK